MKLSVYCSEQTNTSEALWQEQFSIKSPLLSKVDNNFHQKCELSEPKCPTKVRFHGFERDVDVQFANARNWFSTGNLTVNFFLIREITKMDDT